MVTYMTHPEHGTHIAYSDVEIETCKNNGWSVRDEPKEAPKESPKRETLGLKKVTHGDRE